jgi:hypothetical protein
METIMQTIPLCEYKTPKDNQVEKQKPKIKAHNATMQTKVPSRVQMEKIKGQHLFSSGASVQYEFQSMCMTLPLDR